MLGALSACASRPPAPAPAPPPEAHESDASYDWQALVIAPLGSSLKSVAVPVHEALLFRDETPGATAADEGECYAPDAPAPRFLGRTPDEYLLCFKQDRLARIRASVPLGESEAEAVFREACSQWQRAAAAGSPDEAAPSGAAGGICKGRTGAVRFSARLGPEPAETPGAAAVQPQERAVPERREAQAAGGKATVFIMLDAVPDT